MSAAHTPGPWFVLQNPMGSDCITAEDCTICSMPDWDDDYANEEAANARLIAAAPDLLEALQGLMHKDCGEPAFFAARAAIAKATGGAA